MEPLVFWAIGIVAVFICGWLASYDLGGAIFFQIIRGGMFVVSIILMGVAAAVKNPIVSEPGAIAIMVVIILGLVAIIIAAIIVRFAFEAESKVLYIPAVILLAIGFVATYPGAAHALFSLTAGSS